MLTWEIRFTENAPGTYEMRIPSAAAPGGTYRFVRQLPPDFSDFVCETGDDKPKRIWRRQPGENIDEGLLFCAGNLDTLKDIGARLHDALFHHVIDGASKDLDGEFMTLRGTAAATGHDFRLNIDLTYAPRLARVPWEALYYSGEDLFLGIDTRTNIVRLLDQRGPLPPAIKPPIRMLVAVANPSGDIEAGTEVADIEGRLSQLLDDGRARYEVQILPRATRSQFGNRVEDWKPHIIHFIGHGGFDDDKGLIYLHDESDPQKRDPIDSATLRDFVRNDCPWLVVLNSCLSGAAARIEPFGGAAQNLIRVNVPFVVAMQSPVSDQAAVRFSQRFYASLLQEETVAAAVSRGRNAIKGLGEESLRAELITPVLYMSGQADRLAIASKALKPKWRVNLDRALVIVTTITGIAGAVFTYLQWEASAPTPQVTQSSRIGVSAPNPAGDARAPDRDPGRGAEVELPAADADNGTESEWSGSLAEQDRLAFDASTGGAPTASIPTNAVPDQGRSTGHSGRSAIGGRPSLPAPPPRRSSIAAPTALPSAGNAAGTMGLGVVTPEQADRQRLIRQSIGGAFIGIAIGALPRVPAPMVATPRIDGGVAPSAPSVGSSSQASVAPPAVVGAPAEASQPHSRARAGLIAQSAAGDQVRLRGATRTEDLVLNRCAPGPFGICATPRRSLVGEQARARGGPHWASARSRYSLYFASGEARLHSGSTGQLEAVALRARNGAIVRLTPTVGPAAEPVSAELAQRRVEAASGFLLSRGVPPAAIRVGAPVPANGSGPENRPPGLLEIAVASATPTGPVQVGPAFPVLASFEKGSDSPIAIDLEPLRPALSAFSGTQLAVELLGYAEAEEAAADPALAARRAQGVAGRLRQLGLGEASLWPKAAAPAAAESISTASGFERRVDGRLVLNGAQAIPPLPQGDRLPLETQRTLDHVAAWLVANPTFGVHVALPTDTVDQLAAKRLRRALERRDVAAERIEVIVRDSALAPPSGVASPDAGAIAITIIAPLTDEEGAALTPPRTPASRPPPS